jgi:hypothetical protein
MTRNLIAVTGVTVLLGLTIACTSDSSTPLTPTVPETTGASSTAPDGTTLKVSAPVPQSPVGGVKPSTGPATLVVSPSTAAFTSTPPVQYRFQVFNAANAIVEDVVSNSPTHAVDAELTVNQNYTWVARAEYEGSFGPWSSRASFVAPETAFLNDELADPLTNGKTVGQQRGGIFLPGRGWQSLTVNDAISYDLSEPCWDNCTLEFDVTNIGEKEGFNYEKDLKFVSMGNASHFGEFTAFRNHDWKMHIEQRADFSSGMMTVWRNGGQGDGKPGDNRIKLTSTPIRWDSENTYHFRIDWATTGYAVRVNDILVMRDSFSGGPYRPPVHRISLGCYPRNESFVGIIYSNVKLRKED